MVFLPPNTGSTPSFTHASINHGLKTVFYIHGEEAMDAEDKLYALLYSLLMRDLSIHEFGGV